MSKNIKRKIKSDLRSFKKNWQASARHISFIFVIYAIIFCLVFLWNRNDIKEIEESGIASPKSVQITPKINTELQTSKPQASWLSFGDSFSSSVYLNNEETTMFLDERMTALIFPPIYDFDQVERCEDNICGLSDLIMMDKLDVQKPDKIPPALSEANIISSSLHKLSSRYLASFIVLENGQENIYLYFFDGDKFSPIITNSTDVKMRTKYGRGGGRVSVGGNDDNFVVIYNGYEGLGVHYYNENVFDISRFLGLRVSDGGFSPYIIKQGEGLKSVWYVLSLNRSKPRLIKMWQNGTEEIVGAHDFSYIFKNISDTLIAFKPTYQRGELLFIFKTVTDNYYLKTFSDKGFDNSKDRRAMSVNINSKLNQVSKAIIKSLGVRGNAKIFLGQDTDNFIKAEEGKEIRFKKASPELFWKITFPRGADKEYSPWLEHINYLDYYVQE